MVRYYDVMQLSLMDAARALGKSARQIRYQIKTGHLKAQKIGGRWFIEVEDLPLSKGQQRARLRKADELNQTIWMTSLSSAMTPDSS